MFIRKHIDKPGLPGFRLRMDTFYIFRVGPVYRCVREVRVRKEQARHVPRDDF